MTTLLASLVGGALLILGFPPYGWAPPAWFGVGVLLWAWRRAPSPAMARRGAYLAGAVFFAGLFWWLGNVELVAYLPLVALQASAFIIIGHVARRFADRPGIEWVVAVTGSWALAEFLRVRWPFGGFPWGTLGLTIDGSLLLGSAQWIGATGWTVLIVGLAATAVAFVDRRLRWEALVAVAGAVFVVGSLGFAFRPNADGPPIEVVVVQGNSPCPGSSCPDERLRIYQSHLELTRGLAPGVFDLVVWPESSTGFASDPVNNPDIAAAIGAEARRLDAHILVGGDRDGGTDAFINANVVFSPDGEIVTEYRKRHPVPFGEYVPLRPLVDWIPALDQVPRDMIPGDGVVLIDLPEGPLGSVISYEGAFARYEREMARSGARLLVVATNEASFGDSPASDQFLAISRVRSAEMGMDIVHAAVTGKSALIESPGVEVERTGLFTAELISGTLSMRGDGDTVYVRMGDVLQVVSILALLVLAVGRRTTERAAAGDQT